MGRSGFLSSSLPPVFRAIREEFVSDPCEGDIDADGHEGCDDQGCVHLLVFEVRFLEWMIIWPSPPRTGQEEQFREAMAPDGRRGWAAMRKARQTAMAPAEGSRP